MCLCAFGVVYLCIFVFVCLFVCLCVCVLVCLCGFFLFVCVLVCVLVYVFVFVCLFVCLFCVFMCLWLPFGEINLLFFSHAVADGVKDGQLLQGQDGVSVIEAGLVAFHRSHAIAGSKQILYRLVVISNYSNLNYSITRITTVEVYVSILVC